MKKTRYLVIIIYAFSFLFYACNSDNLEQPETVQETDEAPLDSLDFKKDTETQSEYEKENVNLLDINKIKDKELKENTKAIEKTYGSQWEFCDCVTKMDSVNTALFDAEDDDEFELIMERSDYIDNKCKHMFIQAQGTPEERHAHQQRVDKCLKNKNN